MGKLRACYVCALRMVVSRPTFPPIGLLDPRYARVWYNKGCLLVKLRRHEEPISYCDRIIEIDPRLKTAREFRLVCLKAQGKGGY